MKLMLRYSVNKERIGSDRRLTVDMSTLWLLFSLPLASVCLDFDG